MASRIVVIDECKHGKHEAHGYFAAFCEGGSRRVLTEGDYALIEKVDGEWPEWATEHVALWMHPLANDPDGFLDDFVDALAGGES